jgi:protein TonB
VRVAGCTQGSFDDPGRTILYRLAPALVVSALVHGILVYAVPVGGPHVSPLPGTTLTARLAAGPEPDPGADSLEPEAARPGLAVPTSLTPAPSPSPRSTGRPERPAPTRPARTPVGPSTSAGAPPSQSARAADPPEASLPLASDPTWYPAKQLDVLPRALAPIRPIYPNTPAEAETGGRVLLLLLIDESGEVTEAAVVEADPEGYFEESALTAARSARFEPGSRAGRRVKSRVLVELNYGQRQARTAP